MILAIVGPTGVGKTKMSISLAKKYNAIIINADAMQVYKGLNIGTAKIKEEEKQGIPHYLFDFIEVEENYTVYDYQKDLRNLLEKNKNKNIILVGGTGLYLKAGLFDYRFQEENDKTNQYEDLSNEELYSLAKQKDKNMDIHPNNRLRLLRFLNRPSQEKVTPKMLYKTIVIGLTTDRENLYNRINQRVENMIQDGLIEEAKNYYDKNIKSKALINGIGYKELFLYFDGKISLEEAIQLIQKNSRHYAKRQYTWFRHQMDVKWFNVNYQNFNDTINDVVNYIEKNIKMV